VGLEREVRGKVRGMGEVKGAKQRQQEKEKQ
jgi:hypothetical protein